MAMDIENQAFVLPIGISANGTIEKTLKTKDTYVDKDIQLTIVTPDAEFERKTLAEGNNGEITATPSINANTYTTNTNTGYAITVNADAHVNPVTVGTKTAGFTAASDTITIAGADAEKASTTVYLKAGALAGDGTVAVTGGNGVELTPTASQPAAGTFYIKASAAGSVRVATAGWVDPEKNVAVETDAEQYYTLKKLTFKNEAGQNETYTELSVDAIPAGGFLYLTEGYIENTKISLADLVPDAEDRITANAANYLLHGYTAIDNEGNEIVGTMQDVKATDIIFSNNDSAQATIVTGDISIKPAADNGSFKLTGNHGITGSATATVNSTGYIVKGTHATGEIGGTASIDASIDKVKLGATVSGDGQVTPILVKETGDAISSEIAKSAPAGQHYVAFSAPAVAKTATVSPEVTVAGYGTTAVFDADDATVTAGSNASGTYYIGIENGTISAEGAISGANLEVGVSFENKDNSGNAVNGITATAPGGRYITIKADSNADSTTVSGSVVTSVTEGYVVQAQGVTTPVSTSISVDAASKSQYIKIYEGEIL